MDFIDDISRLFNKIACWFESIYLTIESWSIAPSWLSAPFLAIGYLLLDVCTSLTYFSLWLNGLAATISSVLNWETVKELILSWLPDIEELACWFAKWREKVRDVVLDFWTSTMVEVQSWIALAVEGLDTLIVAWDSFSRITFPQWTNSLTLLAAEWGDFLTHKLPTLFDISYAEEWWKGKFLDVAGLIDSKIKELTPLWAGWQDIRQQVLTFFTDPWEFLLNRFTDWFLGPEE